MARGVTFGHWCIDVSEATVWDGEDAAPGHLLPAHSAPFPWSLRQPNRGEMFHPIGAPGRKRISRLWIDRKVPATWRVDAPLIEIAGEPVFVAGVRVVEGMAVKPGNRALRIRCLYRTDDANTV